MTVADWTLPKLKDAFARTAGLVRGASPLSARLLAASVEAMEAGGRWVVRLREAFEPRRGAWFDPPLVFLGALHLEARREREHPLRSFYPDAGKGTRIGRGLPHRMHEAVEGAPERFWSALRAERASTVGMTRAAAWVWAAREAAGAFDLVEIGGSSHLWADEAGAAWELPGLKRLEARGKVRHRRAFDDRPSEPDWLRALTWPERPDWRAQLDAAAGRTRPHPAGPLEAAELADDALPEGAPMVVFSAERPPLWPEERRDYEGRLAAALDRRPGSVWAEPEPVETGWRLWLRRRRGGRWIERAAAVYGPVPERIEPLEA